MERCPLVIQNSVHHTFVLFFGMILVDYHIVQYDYAQHTRHPHNDLALTNRRLLSIGMANQTRDAEHH